MEKLIKQLIDQGYLKSSAIVEAFRKIKRKDFVPKELKGEATGNYPLPIGYGQTISQPLTVAFMLELLDLKKGDKVLDIGAGSGWTAALMAEIVGKKGKVIAIERIPELKDFGEENVKKYDFIKSRRVKFICADGSRGWKEEAPYDKIHVAAAARQVPVALLSQLKVGGNLIIPVGKWSQDLVLVKKISKEEYKKKRFPGFIFVPLVADKK